MKNIDLTTRNQIEQARKRLLDLTMRNSLLNFKHSERATNQIRIIDASICELYNNLILGKSIQLLPLPELPSVPRDETTPKFQQAFELALVSDAKYLAEKDALDKQNDVDEAAEEKIIRELKDRVREQLGLKPINTLEMTKKEWAIEQGINPSYENIVTCDDNTAAQKSNKAVAQTLLFPREFKSKIHGLKRIIRSDREEKGTNTFYIAFGFLEWYDQNNSELKHLAPLLLLKLEDIIQDKVKNKITFSSSGESVTINLSLREKLKEFHINLPEFEENDTVDAYMQKIDQLIMSYPKWKVRSYVTIGRFIFSRLAMYDDLKIENWSEILADKSRLLSALFDSKIGRGCLDSIYDIDKDEKVRKLAPLLVTSADSSQHSAIVDVMANDDLVIKGPPGTGKSQTITNLIANALYGHKKVLFMAEKKAALDVVFSRLKHIGLENYCFELHSDKTNVTHVRAALDKAIAARTMAKNNINYYVSAAKIEKLIAEKKKIRDYYDFLQTKIGMLDKTLFEIVWQSKNLEKYTRNFSPTFKNLQIANVVMLKSSDIAKDCEELDRLENLYNAYQESIQNLDDDWKNIPGCSIKTQDVDDLLNQLSVIKENIKTIETDERHAISDSVFNIPNTMSDLYKLLQILKVYAHYLDKKHISYNWLPPLGNAERCKLIQDYNDKLQQYKNLRNELSAFYKQPEITASDINLYKDIYLHLSKADVASQTLNDVLNIKTDITNEIAYWNNTKLLEIAAIVYKKDNFSLGEICALKNIMEHFAIVSEILPFYSQNMDMFKPCNRQIMDKAIQDWSDITEEKEELSKKFDIEVLLNLPDAENKLNEAVTVFNSSGFWGIFKRSYKEAKNFYRLITLYGKDKKQAMIINCIKLLKFVKKCRSFENNNLFTQILGCYFDGLKTNIPDIKKVYEFYKDVYATVRYGENIKQTLYTFFAAKENFDLFFNISNMLLLNMVHKFSLPITDFNGSFFEYKDKLLYMNELEELLSDNFIKQFNNENILITDIINTKNKLEYLEKLKTDIDELNMEASILLPGLINGVNTDDVQLDQLLSFERHISSNKFIKSVSLFIDELVGGNLTKIIDALQAISDKTVELNSLIDAVSGLFVFKSKLFLNTACSSISFGSLADYFTDLQNNKNAVYHTVVFYNALNQTKDTRYDTMISYLRDNKYPLQHLADIYCYLVYRCLTKNVENDNWHTFIPNEFANLAEHIRKLDDELYQLNAQLLINSINQNDIPQGINSTRVSEKTEMQLIYHQLSGHSRNIPLRRFISRAGNAIQALKPCFLMSPISVAQYIPPQSINFDLLIIDEASQMYYEEALGGIFRAKQLVVVGDDKQLPPTPFFQKNNIQDDEFEDDEDIQDATSILDTCVMQGFDYRELLWHYRSKDSSLIEFSNAHFYNDNLKIFPSPVVSSSVNGVHRVFVNGIYKNRQNEDEANAIISAIKQFVRKYPQRSLGIATINTTQKALIEKKCDLLYEQDISFQEYCDKWANGLESFFVKNLENVQGDERDYIFVSTVYGPEIKDGKVAQRFGPINGKYGHRRLNVLFTRAKYGLTLFTSLKSEDIVISETSTIGLKVFKDYLLYAETGRVLTGTVSGRDFDSEFEKMVYDLLVSKGYEVDKQVGVNGFFIDLAVKHPLNKSYYAVGIECDGAPYHSTKSARDRDCIRQSILEKLGWKIYRIWSKDWFYNTETEIGKLLAYLEDVSKQQPTFDFNDNAGSVDASVQEDTDITEELDLFPSESSKLILSDIEPKEVIKANTIALFDTVKYIRLNDNSEHVITITSQPNNLEKGLINQHTPLAQALLDAEEGEEIEVNDKPLLIKEIIKA